MLAVVIVPLRSRVVWTPDMPPKRKGSRRNRYAPTASRLRHAPGGVKSDGRRVVVSFGSAPDVPPVNGHGQDGRATANDTTTGRRQQAVCSGQLAKGIEFLTARSSESAGRYPRGA